LQQWHGQNIGKLPVAATTFRLIYLGDAMDASLPTGKETRPLNAKSMNSRLSGSETSSNRGGSSDGYGI
jgi:hypothetical protein